MKFVLPYINYFTREESKLYWKSLKFQNNMTMIVIMIVMIVIMIVIEWTQILVF